MIRRVAVLGFLAFSGFMTLSCSDHPIESPVEPQFARKDKPAPAEPKLEEFWVYRAADDSDFCPGGEVVHVVVSGDFIRLVTTVAHDHWFNGVRDFLSAEDDHYEPSGRGPAQPETDWNEDGTMGHIDVCFHGERVDYVYPGGEVARADFVDAPSTSVAGTGADPYAFTVYANTEEKKFTTPVSTRFRPKGVVVDGFEGNPEGETVPTSVWHGPGNSKDARSFAVWEAPDAEGYLSFTELDLAASCQVTTNTVGRGKKATQVTTTTVTAEVAFGFEASLLSWPADGDVWTEAHLRVSQEGEVLYFSGPERELFQSPEGLTTYTWTTDGELRGDVKVELLADNLWLYTGRDDFSYNPGLNRPFTTAGFDGNEWDAIENVSSQLNDGKVPVAHSSPIEVTCGGV